MITLKDIDLEKISAGELGEILIEAKKAYYTSSKPIMDDHTYDTLEEILKQKNPYHRLFSKVGASDFETGFEKKRHAIPMGSQNKVNNYSDLVHYFELKGVTQNADFLVQPKCDGISLEIEYQQGRVVDAITRGDGQTGDVITQNVIKMKNFQEVLTKPFSGSIRCEVVVAYDDFAKLNLISDENYSNPRNAASGISQRLDGKYSQFCTLQAVDMADLGNPLKTEKERVDYLQDLGIVTVESHLCRHLSQVENIYLDFLKNKRVSYPFDIDGLVIKINDLKLQHSLGSHNNRPKGQVAYKFPANTNQARVLNINWQTGPMGSVTPVAQVEPVEISGAIISSASLANYDLLKEKNINIGDIVEISRRGDVIPYVEKVISKVTPGHTQAPQMCPSCQTELKISDKYLTCPNTRYCPAQILGSLNLFIKTLDIKNISEKTIEKLYKSGKVRLPGDFYDLKVEDFKELEGLGEKSGTNIIREIQSKKRITLKQVLDAAAIPNFSSARIQQIINAGFNTSPKILNITKADLEQLPGIKKTLAQKIIEGLSARQDFIKSILDKVELEKTAFSQKLNGKNFVITGSLSRPRKDVITDIENQGGKVSSSVSRSTDYLLTNQAETKSSKYKTARELSIPIINEEQLQEMM
ncbi:MAG: NAD-dependent DNA ligase LigA [Patescibacteria group bacterium]|jgi:DNA ligase (NAD+)